MSSSKSAGDKASRGSTYNTEVALVRWYADEQTDSERYKSPPPATTISYEESGEFFSVIEMVPMSREFSKR